MLDGATLPARLPVAEAVSACAAALRALATGAVVEGATTVADLGPGRRVLGGTAAWEGDVVVWTALRPAARAAGRAYDTAVLIDAAGVGRLVLHGYEVAVLGAAAAAGAAVDLLAPRAAGLVALVGTGGLAAALLEAVCAVRPVTQVRVVGRNAGRAAAFAARTRAQAWVRGATVLPARDAGLATRGAEIILMATASEEPVVPAEEVAAGACLVAAGTGGGWAAEVPPALVERSVVVSDNVHAARRWSDGPSMRGHARWTGTCLVALADASGGCPRPAGAVTLVVLVGAPVTALALCRLAAGRIGA
ncbi:MAG: hypothetical protein QN162_05785 [Armatimonadota bacterium]|nr:hypothetical protein [Armatimonadota bacterium]